MKNLVAVFYRVEKNINWFLIWVMFVFSILRIPSLIEPNWYGDEGITQVVAIAIRQGRLLYKDIWDNKPPLLYLIYSAFNGDLFYIKLASLLFGLASLVLLYILAKRLFHSKTQVFLSTMFFALFLGLPLLEGNIASAENFMHLPILFSAIFLIDGIKNRHARNYIFSGFFLSLAFLIKIVAIFDFLAFLTFLFLIKLQDYSFSPKTLKEFKKIINSKYNKLPEKIFLKIKNEIYFTLAFLLPIIVTSFYFFTNGTFEYYLKSVFLENIGYVGYGNYLFFPMSMLVFKAIFLFISVVFVIKFKEKLELPGIFIYTWLFFSIFNCLFSQRPYIHYLLVLLPATALFLGLILKNKKTFLFSIACLGILCYILFNIFSIQNGFYKKTLPYYKNYLDFILGEKSIVSYQSFFDRNTPRDYDIANFIKTNTNNNENVFLWSDSAQIYALSDKLPTGRYVAAYHISFHKDGIEESKKAIENIKPKYIIATKDTQGAESLLQFYELKFIMSKTKIYERKI